MKRPSTYQNRRAVGDSMMTPMIDVVFLLLVFFLWTSSFQIVEYVLPGQLSVSGGTTATPSEPPPPPDFDPVIVRLTQSGGGVAWTINKRPVASLTAVEQTLREIAAAKSDVRVIIDPDAQVPLGPVIDVYDRARAAGFSEVQFAAEA